MINITILAVYAFVKLNEKRNIRKLYLNNILLLNEILIQEANRLNIEYNSNMSSTYYTELNYKSNNILLCYEDSDGYIIRLSEYIDINILKDFLKTNYSYLDQITTDIDFDYIFFPEDKKLILECKK